MERKINPKGPEVAESSFGDEISMINKQLDWVVGSGYGAGYLPMPGCPAALAYSRARACCAYSRCGTGGLFLCCVFFFHLVFLF